MSGLNCSTIHLRSLHPGKKAEARAWKSLGAREDCEGEEPELHLAQDYSGDSSYMCVTLLQLVLQNRKGRAKL